MREVTVLLLEARTVFGEHSIFIRERNERSHREATRCYKIQSFSILVTVIVRIDARHRHHSLSIKMRLLSILVIIIVRIVARGFVVLLI